MTAEIFTIKKLDVVLGQTTFHFKGKIYDGLEARKPLDSVKILQTTQTLMGSVSTDPGKALKEFNEFKAARYARDELDEPNVDPEEEFRDKMKLLEYAKVLKELVYTSFRFLYFQDPYSWLKPSYFAFVTLKSHLQRYYVIGNKKRLPKDRSIKDHCNLLAKSLRDDDWNKGHALDAHKLVFRCLDMFPYDQAITDRTLDLAMFMTRFYVFDNFTSEGSGSQSMFNTFKEQELPFDSHMRTYDFISAFVNSLNDAHISFKYNCYEQFTFLQPFFFHHEGFKTYNLIITKVNDPQLQEWVDSRIISIDGSRAMYTVYQFTNSIGKAHILLIRYLMGLSRPYFDSNAKDFRMERGFFLKRTTLPNRSYVVYTLKKPDSDYLYEIKVDWMVFKNPSLMDFNDQYQYWKRNCQEKPMTKIVKKSSTTSLARRHNSDDPHLFKSDIKKRSIIVKRDYNTLVETSDGTTPIAIGPGFAFFVMDHPDEGVFGILLIQTFDVSDMDSWFANMRKGFLAFIDKGIKKIILDLTGNSGGVLCLAYSLLGVLSPSTAYPYPATKNIYGTRTAPTDMLMNFSKCAEDANIKVSPFRISSFTNLTSRLDFPPGTTWQSESELQPKIVNGFQSGYSRFSPFLMDKCILKQTPLLADVKPGFETIMLVTDGLCGSSCAVVATYLQQNNSPTMVFATGGPNDPIPAAYAFAGGQVINFENIKDVARRSCCFDLVPEPIEKLQFSMTYRAIFNLEDKKIPLEYFKMPAHWRFDLNLITSSSFSERWKVAFDKGLIINADIQKYIYNPATEGKVVAGTE